MCASAWLALACAAASASAQELAPGFALDWRAPAGCPAGADVRARVTAHLPARALSRSGVRASATVTRAGSALRLELMLQSEAGDARRVLEVASCAAAADATALLIALAIDPSLPPERPAGAEPPGGAPDTAAVPPAVQEPDAQSTAPSSTASAEAPAAAPNDAPSDDDIVIADPPHAAPAASPVLRYAAGATLALDSGMLPQTPAFGLRPWVALSIDRVRVAASGTLWLAGHAAAPDYRGAVLEGRGLGGDLALGVELAGERLALVPYAVAELVELTVSTEGISDPGSAGATWAAAGAGLHAGYRFGRQWRVTLDGSGRFAVRRPRWLVRTDRGDAAVLSAAPATLRVSAGVAYEFP